MLMKGWTTNELRDVNKRLLFEQYDEFQNSIIYVLTLHIRKRYKKRH